MGKRTEIRARRRRQKVRRRVLIVVMMIGGALLIAVALILPSILPGGNSETDQPDIVEITPRAINARVDGTTIGDPEAAVQVDVWVDFQCPACANFSQVVETQIIQAYVESGTVFFRFHHFPFIDGSDVPERGDARLYYISTQEGAGESDQAANASMCAGEQGRFWDFHDLLFVNWDGENEGAFNDQHLTAMAESLDLNMADFEACFAENRYEDQIQQDFVDGVDIGVDFSTPSIFVNGQKVYSIEGERYVPSFDDVAAAIEAALAGE